MEVAVQIVAQFPVKITKRRRWFLASCPVLDIQTQGETEKEAKKNLGEALSLFFISCFERGTLDAALKQCGFRAHYPPPKYKRAPISKREDFIEVPIPFLVSQKKHAACHA